MSGEATGWAWRQRGLSVYAKVVLARLCDFANHEGECWPSQSRIAADCCIPRETVNRAIKQLVEARLIENRAQTQNGVKLVSRYFIRCDAGSHRDVIVDHIETPISDVIHAHNKNLPLELEERASSLRSDDATSASPQTDPVAEIYLRGVKILGEKRRGLLAKYVRDYGDTVVLAAIVACEENPPIEPASFFIRCCEERRRDAPQDYHAKPVAKMSPVEKLYAGGYRAAQNAIRRYGIVEDDPTPAFPLLDGGRPPGNA